MVYDHASLTVIVKYNNIIIFFRLAQHCYISSHNTIPYVFVFHFQAMYGDLILADGQYGGSKGRRWKVDWNRTPQPIQIKLKCLRGVKDKLPGKKHVCVLSHSYRGTEFLFFIYSTGTAVGLFS